MAMNLLSALLPRSLTHPRPLVVGLDIEGTKPLRTNRPVVIILWNWLRELLFHPERATKMNSNVQDTGFAGLPEMEGMRSADVFNLFIVEIFPLNEFQSELLRSFQPHLPMYSDLMSRIRGRRSRHDTLFAVIDDVFEVFCPKILHILGKAERSLQSNNDKEHMNSELPKSLLDKFRDFNMATHNLGIRALIAYLRYMSGPKAAGA